MRAFHELTAFYRVLTVSVAIGTLGACSSADVPPLPDTAVGGTSGATGGSGGTAPAGGSGSGGTTPTGECAPPPVTVMVSWDTINDQQPAFYSTPEALTLASNILYYQNVDHGWPK